MNLLFMKKKNKLVHSIFIIISCCLYACEPGHYGTTFVTNNTIYPLTVTFSTNRMDTVIPINAYETKQIYAFGGLGSGMDYDCCTCEFFTLLVTPDDPSLTILKSISDDNNWELFNPNERKFSSKEIQCTFTLNVEDIQ